MSPKTLSETMNNQQSYYETMYILRPDIPEEEVDNHISKYSEILTKEGVEVLDSQMRGKRRLAYSIAKHKEGIYVQLSHKGDGSHIETLEKSMRLSEDVIRYLTVKQEGPFPIRKSNKANEKNEKDKNKEVKEEKEEKVSEEKKEKAKDSSEEK